MIVGPVLAAQQLEERDECLLISIPHTAQDELRQHRSERVTCDELRVHYEAPQPHVRTERAPPGSMSLLAAGHARMSIRVMQISQTSTGAGTGAGKAVGLHSERGGAPPCV